MNISENRITISAQSYYFDKFLKLLELDIQNANDGKEVFLTKDVFSLKKYISSHEPQDDNSPITNQEQVWRLKNWGVKFDFNEVKLIKYSENIIDNEVFKTATIYAETLDGTPDIGLVEISKKFSNINFSLFYKHHNVNNTAIIKIKNGLREDKLYDFKEVEFSSELLFENIKLNEDNNIEFNITFSQRKDMENFKNSEKHFLNTKITINEENINKIINTKSIDDDTLILEYDKNKLFDFAFNECLFTQNNFPKLIKDKVIDNIEDLVKIFDYLRLNKNLSYNSKKTSVKKI